MARMSDAIDFDEIDITNDLMFRTVFQDPALSKRLVEILLGIELKSVELVEGQRLLDDGPYGRAGIVDMLVRDADGNMFDVEMQNRTEPDLALRARRYLSLIDLMALDRGQPFSESRGAIVIFICARDPFGRGWKRYNYPCTCVQDGKPLDDRTEIVFVNVAGTKGGGGTELDSLLHYLRDNRSIESEYVRSVDEAVRAWRDDPLWRRQMVIWSEMYRDDFAYARAKGREDGLEAGRREGLAEGREAGLAEGREAGLAEGREAGLAEGREAGLAEGATKQLDAMAELARRLEAEGRGAELVAALQDKTVLDRLMHEFEIGE